MSVNKVILIGNLGGDPNMRYTSSGTAMANFSLATTEYRADQASGEKKERTEWHRLVAFGRTAEIISQYCRKGSKIYVEGRLQTRSWTDQSNQMRYTTEIIIDNVQLLTPKGSGGAASYDDGYGAAPSPAGGGNNDRGGFPNNEGYPAGGSSAFGGGNNFASDLPAASGNGKKDDGFDNDSDIPF